MNPELANWAARHRITPEAWHKLSAIFGAHGSDAADASGRSEAYTTSRVRLEAGRLSNAVALADIKRLAELQGTAK